MIEGKGSYYTFFCRNILYKNTDAQILRKIRKKSITSTKMRLGYKIEDKFLYATV